MPFVAMVFIYFFKIFFMPVLPETVCHTEERTGIYSKVIFQPHKHFNFLMFTFFNIQISHREKRLQTHS